MLWITRSADLHRNVKIKSARKEVQKFSKKHEAQLDNCVNIDVLQLLDHEDYE